MWVRVFPRQLGNVTVSDELRLCILLTVFRLRYSARRLLHFKLLPRRLHHRGHNSLLYPAVARGANGINQLSSPERPANGERRDGESGSSESRGLNGRQWRVLIERPHPTDDYLAIAFDPGVGFKATVGISGNTDLEYRLVSVPT